jgi:aminoglycoside phosphotransferase (APT) family kinase protein
VTAPLAVGGTRLGWEDLPHKIRRAIEDGAGSPVVRDTSQTSGFSPGLASVLELADARAVFVKAAGSDRDPEAPVMHRREAQVLAALPAGVPTPRLLWTYDDGDWVALMTEVVDGSPPVQPWRPDDLDAFLAVAVLLVERLTPSTLAAPAIQDMHAETFTGWQRLVTEPAVADAVDPWARRHIDRLADIERGWPVAARGESLLHGDLRAGNVLLTSNGAVVVDWPNACVGAGWIDLLLALPSIVMHGGGDPQRLWESYPPARDADADAVTAVLTAATGYFLYQARQPDPPNFPLLRRFQQAQGEAALAWLRRRIEHR